MLLEWQENESAEDIYVLKGCDFSDFHIQSKFIVNLVRFAFGGF